MQFPQWEKLPDRPTFLSQTILPSIALPRADGSHERHAMEMLRWFILAYRPTIPQLGRWFFP